MKNILLNIAEWLIALTIFTLIVWGMDVLVKLSKI